MENNIQNQIGHGAFGTFVALFSFTFIFTSFSDLGIYHYFTKQMAANVTFMDLNLPVILPFKILITLLFPFFVLMIGWGIGYKISELNYLIFIGLLVSGLQFIQFLRGIFQAKQLFNSDTVISILERILLIFIVLVLLYTGITLEKYVYARFTAVLLTLLAVVYYLRMKFGQLSIKWNRKQLSNLLKASFPFAIINLVYGINERIDMVMLERLASNEEAGIYAGAYRWIDAVMMYLWTILPFFFAKFAAHRQAPQEQLNLLQFGQVICSVPLIFISVFAFFYGDKLFWQYTNSSPAELQLMQLNLQVLIFHVLVNGFFAIYANLLAASNYEIAVSKWVILSIILNVTLNFAFIPAFGSLAASVNTLISAITVSVGYVFLVKTKIKIAVPAPLIFKLVLSTGALTVCFYLLQFTTEIWWVNAVISGLFFLVVLALLRIVNLTDLKASLFKSTG